MPETSYHGSPYSDSRYHGGAQSIPGDVMCAYFDEGGEGISYHTDWSVNQGSGILNPLDGSYLHAFRADEPVGTTYTKPGIDDTAFNSITPEMEMTYLGWTAAGMWLNYTVKVDQDADYALDLLYTAADEGGAVSLSVDGEDRTGPLELPTTRDENEPLDWRQVHHWAWSGPVATIGLTAGIHVLTLRIEVSGHMNFAKLTFTRAS